MTDPVAYIGDDGPPIPGDPELVSAEEFAELQATVEALRALIAGE